MLLLKEGLASGCVDAFPSYSQPRGSTAACEAVSGQASCVSLPLASSRCLSSAWLGCVPGDESCGWRPESGLRNLSGRRNKALLKIAGENSFPLALEENPVREAGAWFSWQGGPKCENTELSLAL